MAGTISGIKESISPMPVISYLLWAQEICGDPTLVREDRVGQTPGASVVPPGAQPSS